MLAPNPTNDRLRFILKTYGKKYPQVVMDMVAIIAETVGEDRWKEKIRDAVHDADPIFYNDFSVWIASGSHRMDSSSVRYPIQFAEATVNMVNELPKFRTRHRADPIFPWIATQLVMRQKALAAPPGEVFDSATQHREASEAYGRLVLDTKRAGTTLAMWYERTRPNLGEWDLHDALKEAKEWADEHGPVPQGEVVTKLKDGWTAQLLTTQEQLSREGDVMQHCVGSYGADVAKGRTKIYSLRDEHGRPHVTIEVKNDRVQQIQGKQDTPPAKQYVPYVEEFKEWLEEEGVDTNKIPAHLVPYVDALNEYAHDNDIEEYLVEYAENWRENTRSIDSTIEWLKMGFSASEYDLAGALEYEDVTPDEYSGFPSAVHYKITYQGGVPNNLDDLVAVARMAVVLEKLAPSRIEPKPASAAQLRMFDKENEEARSALLARVAGQVGSTPDELNVASKRRPGHDPVGLRPVKRRWRDTPEMLPPSLNFETWDQGHRYDIREEDDVRWLYPAEEWRAESFVSDPDKDEYVGPWFIHYFTPEQATEWWDAGVTDGNLAAELREYRVTPEMIEKANEHSEAISESLDEFDRLKRAADSKYLRAPAGQEVKAAEDAERDKKRYAKVIAQQIAEQIDSAGVYRNPRKRTSRRTSRSRR